MRWIKALSWYECQMLTRRRAAIGAACLALALPSAALAGGSAGDNQYQDPLGNSPPKSTTQQATTPAPPPASAPAATSPATTSAAPTTTQSSGRLPRTGLPLGPLVALGAGLIAAGLLIRRLA
jgi:hypothetical protein